MVQRAWREGDFVSGTQASALTGCSIGSLRKWEDNGLVESLRTPAGVRRYSVTSLRKRCNIPDVVVTAVEQQQTATEREDREDIMYCRVSTTGQREHLDRQVELMRTKYPQCRVFTDVGSGLNFKRKGFRSILELCFNRRLAKLRVSHKDRLCRFAFDLLQWIFNRHGAEIVVEDDEKGTSPSAEFTDDLLSVITVFTARHNGAKSYKRAIEALEGEDQQRNGRSKRKKATNREAQGAPQGRASHLEDTDVPHTRSA